MNGHSTTECQTELALPFTRTVVSEKFGESRQCTQKIDYPTFESALQGCHETIALASKGGTVPCIFTVYVCPYCFGFHVGRLTV